MPDLSRRVLFVLAAVLAVAGVVGSATLGAPATVVSANAPVHKSGSAEPSTTLVPETTTTAAPTTTTTAVPVKTTVMHHVATTTTTELARHRATLAGDVAGPTTPCTWSVDVWPQLNAASPSMSVHVTAPAQPNNGLTITVYQHGTTTRIAGQGGRTDGNGHLDENFLLTNQQVGTQVDMTASMVIGNVTGYCDPKPWTTTLTMNT